MITALIVELQAAGFGQTADMLAIARLDLLACLHGVSEEEMEFLISMPAAQAEDCAPAAPARAKRPRKKAGRSAPAQNKSG